MNPTEAAYNELRLAYDHFNRVLFEGALPACLITFQREKRTYGYFSRKRFITREGETTDEIALNPAYFAVCPIEEILQTLVHEMVHLWQAHFGDPGRRGYHNKEWADKMEAIGLMPSATGKPGGAKTGEKMADYLVPGARFDTACKDLLTREFRITWMDTVPILTEGSQLPGFIQELIAGEDGEGVPTPAENKSNRIKYQCTPCKVNVWGKPGLSIICGECSSPFVPLGHAPSIEGLAAERELVEAE
jgi:predicted SprT family Zn-dependent metalloprotease